MCEVCGLRLWTTLPFSRLSSWSFRKEKINIRFKFLWLPLIHFKKRGIFKIIVYIMREFFYDLFVWRRNFTDKTDFRTTHLAFLSAALNVKLQSKDLFSIRLSKSIWKSVLTSVVWMVSLWKSVLSITLKSQLRYYDPVWKRRSSARTSFARSQFKASIHRPHTRRHCHY